MSNETWDYLAAAAESYGMTAQTAEDKGAGATAFGFPIVHFLTSTASSTAVEFSRLLAENVPEPHARVAAQLSLDHHYAMLAAEEILEVGYVEWRTAGGVTSPGDTY